MARKMIFILAIWDMICLGMFLILVILKVTWNFIALPLFSGMTKVCTQGNFTTETTSTENLKKMLKAIPLLPLEDKDAEVRIGIYLFGCFIWFIANFYLIFATKDDEETPKKKKIVYLKRWSNIMLLVILILWTALRNELNPELICAITLAYRFYLLSSVGGYRKELEHNIMVNGTKQQESSTAREINNQNLGGGVKYDIEELGDKIQISILRKSVESIDAEVIKGHVPIEMD